MRQRLGWAVVGAVALASVLAVARATVAGPLDPPGPVGSTMRTLDELLPSWGKTLDASGGCASKRFTCVLPTAGTPAGEGVLDHETGLVWQRAPGANNLSFGDADVACRTTKIGGRYGWRLPLASEIMTLIDDTQSDSLPAGHPFTIATDVYYWTQTPDATNSQFVQVVTFLQGGNTVSVEARPRDTTFAQLPRAFCVRGTGDNGEPQAADELPAWSRTLDATGGCHSARFQCVMDGTAVLDRETGLVWEMEPSASPMGAWSDAQLRCQGNVISGRAGWRLPLISELNSLFPLPAGHPFTVVGTSFWTASQIYQGSVIVGTVNLAQLFRSPESTGATAGAWCVRGPGSDDGAP